MRLINRIILTQFCQNLDLIGLIDAATRFSETTTFDSELESNYWCDEEIDEEIKTVLVEQSSGHLLPVDLISHLEYFYNTLGCDQTI